MSLLVAVSFAAVAQLVHWTNTFHESTLYHHTPRVSYHSSRPMGMEMNVRAMHNVSLERCFLPAVRVGNNIDTFW